MASPFFTFCKSKYTGCYRQFTEYKKLSKVIKHQLKNIKINKILTLIILIPKRKLKAYFVDI